MREEARNTLRAVVSAQFAYYAEKGEYAATLDELIKPQQYIDPSWASGSLPHGITLTLKGSGQSFKATAACLDPPCTFTADETGEIH